MHWEELKQELKEEFSMAFMEELKEELKEQTKEETKKAMEVLKEELKEELKDELTTLIELTCRFATDLESLRVAAPTPRRQQAFAARGLRRLCTS